MELVLAVALLALAVVAVVIGVRWSARRRRGGLAHDDTTRVGGDPQLDSRQATRRAEGSTAWTRIGGGGV